VDEDVSASVRPSAATPVDSNQAGEAPALATKRRVRTIRVWDIPTRLFHLGLVLLFPFAWWTEYTEHMDWHKLAGFAIAALLVFRLFWGFVGSSTARFSNFVSGPRRVWRYLNGREPPALGHNPLGSWSVVFMLTLLLLQVGLGLFAADQDGLESGPLAEFIRYDQARSAASLHAVVFNVLLAALSFHIAAVIIHHLRGHNLIGPMLSGRVNVTSDIAEPAPATRTATVVALLIACAVFLTLWRLQVAQV
jgi:cytochrome b